LEVGWCVCREAGDRAEASKSGVAKIFSVAAKDWTALPQVRPELALKEARNHNALRD